MFILKTDWNYASAGPYCFTFHVLQSFQERVNRFQYRVKAFQWVQHSPIKGWNWGSSVHIPPSLLDFKGMQYATVFIIVRHSSIKCKNAAIHCNLLQIIYKVNVIFFFLNVCCLNVCLDIQPEIQFHVIAYVLQFWRSIWPRHSTYRRRIHGFLCTNFIQTWK